MDEHKKNLQELCRVCTKRLGRVSYDCRPTPAIGKGKDKYISYAQLLTDLLHLEVESDDPNIHPPKFCNSCYLAMQRMRKSLDEGKVYRTSLVGHVWSVHSNDVCETCDTVNKRKVGGRPKRKQKIAGCPKAITEHIHTVSGPKYKCSIPLKTDRFLPLTMCSLDDFVCRSCDNILDEPVELPCKHMICCSCCFDHLKSNMNSFCCASCKENHLLTISSFGKPASLTLKFMSQLMIHCDHDSCHGIIYLCDLQRHVESKCTYTSNIRHALTVNQILEQPLSTPPTQAEMDAAGHVVRKLLCQSSRPFNLPTGGWVSL